MTRLTSRAEQEALPRASAASRVLAALVVVLSAVLLLAARSADAATTRIAAATVTVEQAASQSDPASGTTVLFTATFNQAVTGFTDADVTLAGTAGATTAAVSGTGPAYTITVSGMTTNGTVIASIGANKVVEGNSASTSADNTVAWDGTRPTVTIDQAPAQVDPATAGPITFRAVFSEPVNGFADGDVTIGGTAEPSTVNVSGSGTTYTISVTGMTKAGTVTAAIGASKVTDTAGNQNLASTSTDNSVTYAPPVDTTKPTVTVDQAPAQVDPTTASPIAFRAVFSEPVSGFASGDVTIGGTADATTAAVSGSGTTYTINVSGMTKTGTVVVSIPASKVTDAAGNGNVASTSADNTVTYTFTTTRPTVTVNQAASQVDPASAGPILFTAVFSESVNGFAPGDVALSGTASPQAATISGSGTTYTISVTGMTQSGTVVVAIPANVVSDSSGDQNVASTSTDNQVTYQAPVTVTAAWAGDKVVATGRRLTLATRLTTNPADSACRKGRAVAFYLDRNPGPLGATTTVPGVEGAWIPVGTATTSDSGLARTGIGTTGWAPGTYRLLAVTAAAGSCPGASVTESLGIVRRGLAAQGDGWIRVPGSTDFSFTITRVGDGAADVRGSITVVNGRRWKVVGNPTSIVVQGCDGLVCADVAGVGRLYERVQVSGRRTRRTSDDRYRWIVRTRDAQFTLKLVDRGGRRDARDRFGIAFTTPGLEGLRGTTGGDTVSVRRGFVEIRG